MSYPESVSFDVRVTVDPKYLGFAVDCLKTLARNVGIVSVDFPTPDALPYANDDEGVMT